MNLHYNRIQFEYPYELQHICEFSFITAYGEHPTVELKAMAEDEVREAMLKEAGAKTPLILKDEQGTIIFSGYTANIRFAQEEGIHYLYLKACGATAALDIKKKNRSFFKQGITYADIVKAILSEYPGADMTDNIGLDMPVKYPMIQYKETDWEFLKRLTSLFEATLKAEPAATAPLLELGKSSHRTDRFIEVKNIVTERRLQECAVDYSNRDDSFSLAKKDNSPKGMQAKKGIIEYPDEMKYTLQAFTLKEYYPCGMRLHINGAELQITHMEAYSDMGEVSYDYVARMPHAVKTTYKENPHLKGAYLPGTVTARGANEIALTLDIDEEYEGTGKLTGEDCFFTYAIETKGIYCIPEEGAKVDLYFPNNREWEAIATHSIRNTQPGAKRINRITNPEKKSFSTTHGSAMEFTPESITLSPDDGKEIKITFAGDGNIQVDGKDLMITGRDINIGEEGDKSAKVSISAGDTLFMSRIQATADGNIAPVEDHFIGVKAVSQIYSTGNIYHETTGPAMPVTPTYDDSELVAQEEAQAAQNNENQANILIARNREARASFGKGLLMAALGAALIVATGGAAAAVVVGTVIGTFAVADMAEATHSHELAMQGDYRTPAENLLKEVVPEPAYSLIENGFIIAGSVMFAGPAVLGGAGLMTGMEFVGDIWDGQIDKGFMDYLDSFATGAMVFALTGPRGNGASAGKAGSEAALTFAQRFGPRFAQQFASSTAFNVAQGNLSFKTLTQDLLVEGVSALVGVKFNGCKASNFADMMTDVVMDSGIQVWDLLESGQPLSEFDWGRVATTATRSFIMNCMFSGDPINTARGNLLYYKEDLSFKGLYGDISWFRRYDSVLDYEGAFGKGWIHAYESFLAADTAECFIDGETAHVKRISVMLPDTHIESFLYQDGIWQPEKQTNSYRLSHQNNSFLLEEYTAGDYKAYTYDSMGRLTSIKEKRGAKPILITYKEIKAGTGKRPQIKRISYPGGQYLDFTYGDNRIAKVTDHAGRTVSYTYENGMLTAIHYPTGGCQRYEYDEEGRLATLKGEDGREFIHNIYDRKGRVVTQQYPDGNHCDIQYFDRERKTIFTFSDTGRTETYYYNSLYEVVRAEYGNDTCELYEYDTSGNRISHTDRNGNTTRTHYNPYGQIIKEEAPEGLITEYSYSPDGLLLEKWDNTGAHSRYTYDENCFLTQETETIDSHRVSTWSYTRDTYGRMLTETDPLGNTTTFEYDENITEPSYVLTPTGDEFEYTYDRAGRRSGITTAYGTVSFTYSETGAISGIKDALGNTTRYFHDATGNVLKEVKPNQYNEADDNGAGTYYTYDYLDRLIKSKTPDGTVHARTLDMDGNVVKEFHPEAYHDGEDYSLIELPGIEYTYDKCQNKIMEKYPDGGIKYFHYDKNGKVTKVVQQEEYALNGAEGKGITYTYDRAGRITRISAPSGEPLKCYTYDLKGRVTQEYNGTDTAPTLYTYNLRGDLIEKRIPVKETEGRVYYNVTIYEYDTAGNRVKERRGIDTAEAGETPLSFLDITMTYDKRNRLIKVEDSLGAAMTYTYDCLNNCLTERARINENSTRILIYTYDAAARLTEVKESVDRENLGAEPNRDVPKRFLRTTYTYDRNGNITKISTPNGGSITREYDINDRLIKETVSDNKAGINKVTAYNYDRSGNVVKKTVGTADRTDNTCTDSYTTTYKYDLNNRLICETDNEGSTTRYFYNLNGELIRSVDADNYNPQIDDGKSYTYHYNEMGQLSKVYSPRGILKEENTYNLKGQLVEQKDALGRILKNGYDLGGRRTHIYGSDNSPLQTYTYDGRGNITGVTDGENNRTTFLLDEWGRITKVNKPDGSHETYTYDYAGNITTTTDGNGGIIRYTYNSLNKLASITDQAGSTETFTYDNEGNTATHTDRNGKVISYNHGIGGMLLEEKTEDGNYNHHHYDSQGRLIRSENRHVTYTYDYTPSGKIRCKYVNGRKALEYTYTKSGKVASITDITGITTTYSYDEDGRLTSVCENGKLLAQYRYRADDKLETILFANGIRTDYTYDEARNLARLTTTGADGKEIMSYSYRYDRNGNRLEKQDNVKRAGTLYDYDSLQRLSSVAYPNGHKESYDYDLAGNRVRKNVSNGTVTEYHYDIRNRLTEQNEKQSTNTANQTVHTITYTYDNQGSLLQECGLDYCKKYMYNDLHQTIAVDVIRGREAEAEHLIQENIYDAEGMRYGIVENGVRTNFIHNGWSNFVELDEENKVKKRLIRGIGIVASEDDGAYHYYHGNERGDVEYVTDLSGDIVNSYEYDAFGRIIKSEESIANRYTYKGEAYDGITEQYYLRERYYNPRLSRFTQEDVYRGDGLNLYAFCASNPVMYVDPSGYAKKCSTGNEEINLSHQQGDGNVPRTNNTDNILNKPVSEWTDVELQRAIDSIHNAQYHGAWYGNLSPMAVIVNADGRVVVTKNGGPIRPNTAAGQMAIKIFGNNVEMPAGRGSNYLRINGDPDYRHAEARAIQAFVQGDTSIRFNTGEVRLACSHYACGYVNKDTGIGKGCTLKLYNHNVKNVTGSAQNNSNKIGRTFLSNLWELE